MPIRCGIDLGTTYSSISWFDKYNNRVDTADLNTASGLKTLRSVVYYPGAGQPVVVGEAAWNAARQAPDRVVYGIKRSMGSDYVTAPIDGVQYTPQQVSSEILKCIARDASAHFGEEIKEVVVTVPAHFGDNERAATREAAELAGLVVIDSDLPQSDQRGLLSEPHASALAFSIEKMIDIMDKYLLVYDLGGGTFDVTLVHATKKMEAKNTLNLHIDTLCKDGNAHLGGLDFDHALSELVAEKVMQQHGIDIRQDPSNDAILMDNCEKAKRDLSFNKSVSIIADLAGHSVNVTSSEFEERTRDLLVQTEMLLKQVLADAESQHQIGKDKIDVLLAGGATRMPMVGAMIEGVMGKPPLQHRNPELLVTIGAAYWAHLISSGDNVGISDRTIRAVGIEVMRPDGQGGYKKFFSEVIPKGAEFGKTFEKVFETTEDDMTEVAVVLYEGDSDELEKCDRIMEVTITGLPGGRPRGQLVRVNLTFDGSGILRGSAEDVATSKVCDIVMDRRKVMTT
jgi:molecular chaperone DnaK